jgi:hypothetical protein
LLERLRWQVLCDMHTRVNERTIVLFPYSAKKYHGIKPSAVGSAQRVTESELESPRELRCGRTTMLF